MGVFFNVCVGFYEMDRLIQIFRDMLRHQARADNLYLCTPWTY